MTIIAYIYWYNINDAEYESVLKTSDLLKNTQRFQNYIKHQLNNQHFIKCVINSDTVKFINTSVCSFIKLKWMYYLIRSDHRKGNGRVSSYTNNMHQEKDYMCNLLNHVNKSLRWYVKKIRVIWDFFILTILYLSHPHSCVQMYYYLGSSDNACILYLCPCVDSCYRTFTCKY